MAQVTEYRYHPAECQGHGERTTRVIESIILERGTELAIDRQLQTTEYPNVNIYGGRDPREIPAYRVTDAASYLGIPATTFARMESRDELRAAGWKQGLFQTCLFAS